MPEIVYQFLSLDYFEEKNIFQRLGIHFSRFHKANARAKNEQSETNLDLGWIWALSVS